MNERDLYNDGVWDVFSVEDIETLKDTAYINVLAHQQEYIIFEAGKDFWKFDKNKNSLTQYKDFVSVRDDLDGVLVYDKNQNIIKDYGAVLFDTIQTAKLDDLPHFSLAERNAYLENTSKNTIKLRLNKEFGLSLKKHKEKSNEIANNISETINHQETKFIADAIQMALHTLALFYTYFTSKYKEHKRNEIIKGIINKLDNNELNISDVLSDKVLNERIPELHSVLQQWQKGLKSVDIETSKSIDNQAIKQENLNKNLDLSNSKNKEAFIEQLIDNPQINEIAQKIASEPRFHQLNAEKKWDYLLRKTETIDPKFQNKIISAFEKSNTKDPLTFSTDQFVDLDFIQELKEENLEVSPEDFAISIAFLNRIIAKDEISKTIFAEKVEQITGKDNDQAILTILNKVLEKTEKLSQKMTQQKLN